MDWPREFQLVAACAIWPPSPRRAAAILEAARPPLDWDRFVRIAHRHRIVGLVQDGLKSIRSAVPQVITAELDDAAMQLTCESLQMASETSRLQQLFSDTGIAVAHFKGSSLALQAFDNLGLRQARDIDLLVPRDQVEAASALLAGAGYRRDDPPDGLSDEQLRTWLNELRHVSYVHPDIGSAVELHWRFFRNRFLAPGLEAAAAAARVALADGTALPTLARDDLFAYLCAHGASHCWFRLKWLADVGALLSQGPDEPERLYAAAQARGVGPLAAQAILLCQRLLHLPVSDAFAAALRSSARVRLLERVGLWAIGAGGCEIEPTELIFGARPHALAQILLVPGWRYKLAELRVLTVSAGDIKEIHIPRGMTALYPVLRLPNWLFRESRNAIRRWIH